MNPAFSDIVAVIPAYQAADSLPRVLERLRPLLPADRTLVVDDGSTDGTRARAESYGVHVTRHPDNHGKGAALRTGMAWWLTWKDWGALVTLDADGQHAPEDLVSLVSVWKSSGADVVAGARAFSGAGMPWERQLSNRITSRLVSWRTGWPVPDSQCGFRLHARRAVECVRTTSHGFEAETEWMIRAAVQGFRFAPAPVRTIYAGERSSMTYWNTTMAFLRTLFMEV